MARVNKNSLTLVLLLLAGIVVGGFIGYLVRDTAWLTWLNYGQEFSLGSLNESGATKLNLGVIVIVFGLSIKITIASVIGMIIAVLIYRKM